MKTKSLHFLSLLILLFCSCNLEELHVNIEQIVTFSSTIEEQDRTSSLDVKKVSTANDGGFIVVGRREINSFNGEFGFWVKTDECGVTRFSTNLGIIQGTSAETNVEDVLAISGGYLLCGFKVNEDENREYLFIEKRSEDGGLPIDGAFSNFTYPEPSAGYNIIQTEDGGFLIAGEKKENVFESESLVIKLDGQGEFQWDISFGNGSARDLYQRGDGSYGVYIIRPGPEAELVRFIDQDGEEAGGFEFDPIDFETPGDQFVPLGNGRFVVSFLFLTGDFANSHILIVDQAGEEERIIEILDFHIKSMAATADGGFIVIGDPFGFSVSSDDAQVIKFDPEGEEEWRKLYGENGRLEFGESVLQLPDGGYLIAGEVVDFSNNTAAILVIRTDRDGEVEPK